MSVEASVLPFSTSFSLSPVLFSLVRSSTTVLSLQPLLVELTTILDKDFCDVIHSSAFSRKFLSGQRQHGGAMTVSVRYMLLKHGRGDQMSNYIESVLLTGARSDILTVFRINLCFY